MKTALTVLAVAIAIAIAIAATAATAESSRAAPDARCGPVVLPQYDGDPSKYAALNKELRREAAAGWTLVSVSHIDKVRAVACWVR